MDAKDADISSSYFAPEFRESKAKQSEYALHAVPSETNLHATNSQYAAKDLRNFVTVEENAVYQSMPVNYEARPLTIAGAGVPISAERIRAQVRNLADGLYTPALLDGQLYFIPVEVGMRTAYSRSADQSLSLMSYTGSPHSRTFSTSSFSTSGGSLADSTSGMSTTRTCRSFNSLPTDTAHSRTNITETAIARTPNEYTPRSARTARSASQASMQTAVSQWTAISPSGKTALLISQMSPSVRTADSRSLITANSRSRSNMMSDPITPQSLRSSIANLDAFTPPYALKTMDLSTAASGSGISRTAEPTTPPRSSASRKLFSEQTPKKDDLATAASRTMLTATDKSETPRTAISARSALSGTVDLTSSAFRTATSSSAVSAFELVQELQAVLSGANGRQLQNLANTAEHEPMLMDALRTAVAYTSHDVLTAVDNRSEDTHTAVRME